jgi:hypothetical protein
MDFLLGIKLKDSQFYVSIIDLKVKKHSLEDIKSIIVNREKQTQDCLINEYDAYSKIEKHIEISLDLYHINKFGNSIIHDIEDKKIYVQKIYSRLCNLVNINRTDIDIYTELLSILDDALFKENNKINKFYIEDKEYNLESLYYKQDTWINDIDSYTYSYHFEKTTCLDLGECSHILVFLNRYEEIIKNIQHDMKCHKKVLLHTNKILHRIKSLQDIIISYINEKLMET